jgi:hypothetical protein
VKSILFLLSRIRAANACAQFLCFVAAFGYSTLETSMNKPQCKTKSKAVVAQAFNASSKTGAEPGAVAGAAVRSAALFAVVKATQGAGTAWGFVRGFIHGVAQ